MPTGRYLIWTALPGPKLRLRLRESTEICCDDYHEPTENVVMAGRISKTNANCAATPQQIPHELQKTSVVEDGLFGDVLRDGERYKGRKPSFTRTQWTWVNKPLRASLIIAARPTPAPTPRRHDYRWLRQRHSPTAGPVSALGDRVVTPPGEGSASGSTMARTDVTGGRRRAKSRP
jgi:hypothetical protein